MTYSRNDLVGRAQQCMTDHALPSAAMGGKESKASVMPYILRRASETTDLQEIINYKIRKISWEKEEKKILRTTQRARIRFYSSKDKTHATETCFLVAVHGGQINPTYYSRAKILRSGMGNRCS